MSQAYGSGSHDGSEEPPLGAFGCPMLTGSHGVHLKGGRFVVRCSFGWALHSDREIAKCAATDSSKQCWKAREDHGAVHEAEFVPSVAPKRRGPNGPEIEEAETAGTMIEAPVRGGAKTVATSTRVTRPVVRSDTGSRSRSMPEAADT